MRLAVFFPGIGYHCDKPLLYYSRKIASSLGYETVTLSYTYEAGNIRGNKEKMREAFEALYEQAKERLSEIAFDDYEEILFVSKSVGTMIASAYAQKYGITCKQVLYTPLEKTFEYAHDNACAFIGTADPWSEVTRVIDAAKEKGVPIYVYNDVNHSLENDDPINNITILKEVMEITYKFLTYL